MAARDLPPHDRRDAAGAPQRADAAAPTDAADAVAHARSAGLRWVVDTQPGWTRRALEGAAAEAARAARQPAFELVDPKSGAVVDDPAALARVRALAIPPAWTAVWICRDARGHLQATGRDARGRKQYRYHADWQAGRGQTKFERMRRFGAVLPRVREAVDRALASRGDAPTRERVLATLVRLLDTTWLRIGNAEYARANGSFGLSTLRNRHAGVQGDALKLSFVGKSGVRHQVQLHDRRVARVVRRCRELPGQELFQYLDADGQPHGIDSADVNAWLAEAAGERVTAKDFRTWHGSVQALELTLAACAEGAAPCSARDVLDGVARRLGNTPAVCRKAYVHPRVLGLSAALSDDAERAALRRARWAQDRGESADRRAPRHGLNPAERRFMALLRSKAGGGKAGDSKAAGAGAPAARRPGRASPGPAAATARTAPAA